MKDIERNIGLLGEKMNVMKAREEKLAAKSKEYNKALEKNKSELANNAKQVKTIEGQLQTHQQKRVQLESEIQAGTAAWNDMNGRREQLHQRMMATNQQMQGLEAQCQQVCLVLFFLMPTSLF